MTTPAALYKETRERLTQLLDGLDDAEASTVVPSTPEWTVKDVVAHLAGLVDDWLNGRIEGYGTDEWTARQVDERRDLSFDEVLAEWRKNASDLEALMESGPADLPVEIPYITVADVVIHEHDIRGALGRPGGRDSEALQLGVKTYVTGVRQRHAASGLGPMLIRETDGRDWPVGTGDPVITVAAPRFELFRAMAGRRSRAQALAFDWSGDAEPFVDLLLAPNFSWASTDLDH